MCVGGGIVKDAPPAMCVRFTSKAFRYRVNGNDTFETHELSA